MSLVTDSSQAEIMSYSPDKAFSLIESKMRDISATVVGRSLESGLPIKRVAKEIAKDRLMEAKEAGP